MHGKDISSDVNASKLFTLVVSINLTGLILAATGKWSYPRDYSGACVLGNLLVAILMRNELFGRLLYLIVSTLFAKVYIQLPELNTVISFPSLLCQWTPLWFRLACTSILQHLGGVHSGCATSGFGWLIFRLVLIFINAKSNHPAVMAVGVVTSVALAVCILAALPWVRNTHHK